MRLFLAAAALVYAAASTVAITQTRMPASQEHYGVQVILLNVLLIPLLTTWAVTELACLFRRPRLFDRRLKRPLARPVLGAIVASLGAVIAALALPWVDRVLSDSLTTGVAAAIPAFGAVLFLRPTRRGQCIYCTYDLSTGPAPGQPGFGLCPECGASVTC